MSKVISALSCEVYEGIVSVKEAGLRGMITLRGDLASAKMKAAVKKVAGVEVPDVRAINLDGEKGAAWMSPDELLIIVPYAEAPSASAALSKALKGSHHLVASVSDARAVFCIKGKGARDVLAKLSPSDLSPAALQPGEIRRTRLAQAAGAFWMTGPDSFDIVAFRSTATYIMGLLKNAAKPGSEVDHF